MSEIKWNQRTNRSRYVIRQTMKAAVNSGLGVGCPVTKARAAES